MIGKRTKSIRAVKGLSQEFVAEHLGISQSTLARMEMGNPKLDSNQLTALCEVLQIDLYELVNSPRRQTINETYVENKHAAQLPEQLKEFYEEQIALLTNEVVVLRQQVSEMVVVLKSKG